jgi:hypothetical protein
MKAAALLLALAALPVSCYEPFTPEVDTNEKVLVVDGLITDENASYHVKLYYASPYDSAQLQVPATQASVYVKDETGNIFFFQEKEAGDYATDSLQFRGRPGAVYQLNITARNGEKYQSVPQVLPDAAVNDTTYAGFEERDVTDFVTGHTVRTRGGVIMTDVTGIGDSLRAMRYVIHEVNQYWYNICPIFQQCYNFYCWQEETLNSDLNLTDAENGSGSHILRKHEINFVADNPELFGMIYDYQPQGPGLPTLVVVTRQYQLYLVHTRILYIDRYTLNPLAAGYYADMAAQLSSEGRLFDPVAVQLTGNMRCVTETGRRVLGFFEASQVVRRAYELDFENLTRGQPTVTRVPYILPPGNAGCMIDQVPGFWIP